MDENQILTLTQELLSNGNNVNYVVQENLNKVERKEELRSEAQESAENLSDEENIPTQLLLGIGTVMLLTFGFGLIAVSLSNRLT